MKVSHTGWYFTRVINRPLEDESLTTIQKMIFVSLSYFMDKDGQGAYPSYKTIAKIAGCSRRAAIDAVSVLIDKGYIQKRARKGRDGTQVSNDYLIMTTPTSAEESLSTVQKDTSDSEESAPKLEPVNDNQLNEKESAAAERPPSPPSLQKTRTNQGTQRDTQRKNQRSETVRSEEDIELYHSIEQAFLSKNDNQFSNYGKEGKHIWALVDRAQTRSPDTPDEFMSQMLDMFWRLKSSRDTFWSGQPFLASTLNASGIWDRVLEMWRKHKPAPIDQDEVEALARLF